MTKIISIATVILFFTISVNAQGRRHNSKDFQNFKAEKIAFITEAIELTPAEAQKFWPVYNELEKAKWEQISERHDLEKSLIENMKELPDKEYLKLADKLSSYPAKEGELNLKYNKKFLEILSPKKVVMLYIAEVEFRSYIFNRYRQREKTEERKTD